MMPGSHYPYIPPIEEERSDYECGRCNAEVTGATRREMTGDGWVFHALPGGKCPTCDGHPTWSVSGTRSPVAVSREFALCGDCAGMMRTLQAIRISRGVGEIRA